jgi:hypothetical protein
MSEKTIKYSMFEIQQLLLQLDLETIQIGNCELKCFDEHDETMLEIKGNY